MNIIICTDKNNGISFNNRRVSKDKVVITEISKLIGKQKLYIKKKSLDLFDSYKIILVDNLENIPKDAFYFSEESDFLNKADKLYVFNWNRYYPADTYINLTNFNKISQKQIKGKSHDKITLTIYSKGGNDE